MSDSKLTALLRPRDDGGERPPAEGGRRFAWFRRHASALVPLALGVGFLAVAIMLFGDRLLPAREVRLAPVVALEVEGGSGGASGGPGGDGEAMGQQMTPQELAAMPMLFQASGWIEPDPLPIKVPALVDGVVATVEVLEGESVREGQVLATLIDEDAAIGLRAAEANLAALEARLEAHQGQIAITEAQLETQQKRVAVARAELEEQRDISDRANELRGGAIPEREIAQARLQLLTKEAEVAAATSETKEVEGMLQRHIATQKDLEAQVDEARARRDEAQLALDRTRVTAPVDGVVLRLHAVPGQKRMLGMDDPDSATIATLYRPGHLQARIDVPLEEAAQLAQGQYARVRTNFLPDTIIAGRVTRIVGEADIQRNTLQAKVRLEDPDPRLRPEMLCRAEFVAAPSSQGSGGEPAAPTAGGGVTVFVPAAALWDREGNAAAAWALDPSGGRVEMRTLTLGGTQRGDHLSVVDGLRPGDRVVIGAPDGLGPGDRVRPQTP